MKTPNYKNQLPRQAYFFLFTLSFFLIQACPDLPDTKPELADCPVGKSPCVDDSTACCWDTTSHNFTWEIDTLGEYGSYLRDVAIVDENNIWVVGNIETDSGEYNAAHWDGSEWELMGIYSNTLDLYSIKYFSEDDIWVTSHCFPYHWDGNDWTRYHLNDMGMEGVCAGNEIWSNLSSNIYFVGFEGSIVHYDGSSFTKIESDTNINLQDINGTDEIIYITGYNVDNNGHSIALVNETGIWETDYYSESLFPTNLDLGILGRMYSTFSFMDTTYIIGKGGIMKLSISDKIETIVPSNLSFVEGRVPVIIRGNNYNDIVWIDIWGEIVHFNGVSWKLLQDVYNSYPNGQMRIRSMDYINGIFVGVGSVFVPQEKALIILGKQVD